MDLKKRIAAFFKSHGVKNFISHFVQGAIVIAPTAITLFILFKAFQFVSDTFHFVGKIVHPLVDPFIILGILVLTVYIIGRLSSSFIFTPVYDRFEKDIEKVPLIRALYSSVKDIMSAFVGSKRKFNKPVLVTIDKVNDLKQIGFVTQTDLSNMSIGPEYLAVYIPFSYGLSGKLFIVNKENVKPLDAKAAEAMKFVVSGGVTTMDHEKGI
jgi:uncharacterized membrane protein